VEVVAGSNPVTPTSYLGAHQSTKALSTYALYAPLSRHWATGYDPRPIVVSVQEVDSSEVRIHG
ncbi:uncharacterized protein METZ01_LOCUS295004, partial [marine metagenome]